MISNVQEIDDGSYQCRAENEVETLDAAADLIVQGILISLSVFPHIHFILHYLMLYHCFIISSTKIY